jgi:GNAT superfamily N-acetyltransferase
MSAGPRSVATGRGEGLAGVSFRAAGAADVGALTALERSANLVALAHVFPPGRHPFPTDDVAARWALLLEEPGAAVEVVDGDRGRLRCLVAWDVENVRQLAVHPDDWGHGLARAAVSRAVAAIAAGGAAEARLRCLVENQRARGLYEHLGWRATADRRPAPWPPYPEEMGYVLSLP